MNEIKLPFTQNVAIGIAIAIIIFSLGGYMLYFKAKSNFKAQTNEFATLKEKCALSDKMLIDAKTKYENVYDDMKKLIDEVQNIKLKNQDCQTKVNALEAQLSSNKQNAAPVAPAEGIPGTAPIDHNNAPAAAPEAPTMPSTPPASPEPSKPLVPTPSMSPPAPNTP